MKYKICHFLEHVDDRVDFCKLLHLVFKKGGDDADDDDDDDDNDDDDDDDKCLCGLMDHIRLGSF